MSMDSTLTLLINNKNFQGWKSVRVTSGIQRAARDFSLSISERFPGQEQPLRIVPGNSCQILIGSEVVLTGYVDTVAISHSKDSHEIAVTGRSKTQDLIDCGAQPPWGNIKEKSIMEIADQLAAPYKVDIVDAMGGDTETIPELGVTHGSTVFSVIESAARMKALLVTDDAEGRLLLTRAGTIKATTGLELGKNILAANATFDHRKRFSRYEVRGQNKGSDTTQGKTITEPKAVIEDQTILRERVKYISAERLTDGARAEDRGRWEAAVSAGKSVSVSATVHGWRQENGDLWKSNTLVPFKDSLLTIDRELLITEVVYTLSEAGMITTLTLTPKESYQLIPKEKEVNKGIGVWADLKQDEAAA